MANDMRASVNTAPKVTPSALSLRLRVASLMASRAATDDIVHGSESDPANRLRSLAAIVTLCGAASATLCNDSHTNISAILCLAISAGTWGALEIAAMARSTESWNSGPRSLSTAAWRRGLASRRSCAKPSMSALSQRSQRASKRPCADNWLNTSKLCPPASTTASPPSRLQRRWPDWSVFLPCRRSMSAGLSSASWLIRSVLC